MNTRATMLKKLSAHCDKKYQKKQNLITIGSQTLKAAWTNPAETLRDE